MDFILLHHLDALIEGEKALSGDAAIDLRRILARVLGELIRIHLFFVIVVFRNNFLFRCGRSLLREFRLFFSHWRLFLRFLLLCEEFCLLRRYVFLWLRFFLVLFICFRLG